MNIRLPSLLSNITHNLPALTQEGDTIWFATDLLGFAFLRKMDGIVATAQPQVEKTKVPLIYRELTQAVIAPGSYLAGKTLIESNFRGRFNAAVVGVSREGRPVRLPLTSIVIQEGDVLLVESRLGFAKAHGSDSALSLLVPVKNSSPPKKDKGWIAVTLGTAMVLTQIVNGLLNTNSSYVNFIKTHLYRADLINLWPASILTAFLMIVTHCLTCKQATDSVMWDVYLTVAAAFGVSVATEASGVAKGIADLFVGICKSLSSHASFAELLYC